MKTPDTDAGQTREAGKAIPLEANSFDATMTPARGSSHACRRAEARQPGLHPEHPAATGGLLISEPGLRTDLLTWHNSKHSALRLSMSTGSVVLLIRISAPNVAVQRQILDHLDHYPPNWGTARLLITPDLSAIGVGVQPAFHTLEDAIKQALPT